MLRIHWLLAAPLLAFEVWAASLMLTPRVSADYADYYLTRSTACWPRVVSGRYTLGEPLSFRDDAAGQAAVEVKQCGWVAPFSAGTWSRGDRARLHFAFDVPATGVDIALLGSGYVGPAKASQLVEVRVNGRRLENLVFTAETQGLRIITVPGDVAALQDNGLMLQFDFPDRISPKAMGVNDDSRELGLLLEELMIVQQAVP